MHKPVVTVSGHSRCLSPARPRRLPVLLRRAWYGLNQAFRRRIAHTGCTPDQYIVLRNLEEVGVEGLIQSELTGRMSSDPNTVAALVRRMEKQGLVERRRDGVDGRARRVGLTAEGRRRYRELRRVALRLQEEVLAGLESRQQEEFLERLQAVAEACREAAESG
jgi:DNA-binding MarR family transcriptional regulator